MLPEPNWCLPLDVVGPLFAELLFWFEAPPLPPLLGTGTLL